MRLMWLLRLLSGVLAVATYTPALAEPLVIDASGYPQGGMVEIQAADTMAIDFSGVSFDGDPPETLVVHIQHDGRSDYYSLPFTPDRTRYVLGQDTLEAHASPPFPGFEKNAFAYLILGREPSAGALDKGMFMDQWTLYLRIK